MPSPSLSHSLATGLQAHIPILLSNHRCRHVKSITLTKMCHNFSPLPQHTHYTYNCCFVFSRDQGIASAFKLSRCAYPIQKLQPCLHMTLHYTYIFSIISGRLVMTNTLRVYVINPTSLHKGRSVHVQHRHSVWLGNIFHPNWCRPRDVKDQLFSAVLHWFILPYPLYISPSIISGSILPWPTGRICESLLHRYFVALMVTSP